ncbi:MAG: hypothetical protein Q7T55_07480, partial [Solirubrobacteraceae bacterium]|nr:hypothetical protein [Solirubrobacteraceae bacterium]
MRSPHLIPFFTSRLPPLFALLACLAGTNAAVAQAQADLYYNGKWQATIVADDGKRQVSPLVITQFSGVWQGKVGSTGVGKKPCTATRFPITVQTSNDTNFDFTVWGSAV